MGLAGDRQELFRDHTDRYLEPKGALGRPFRALVVWGGLVDPVGYSSARRWRAGLAESYAVGQEEPGGVWWREWARRWRRVIGVGSLALVFRPGEREG